MQKKTKYLTGVILAVAIVFVAGVSLYYGPDARAARDNEAILAVLNGFGSKLKNVTLSGDDAALNSALDENYAAYVTPELLADWKANHAHAPGRLAESPWPDRLTVASMTKQGSGRVISGEVILVSSAETADESADTTPYVAQIIQTDDGWKIAAYQEEKVQTLKKLPTTDEDIPGAK